MDEAVPRGRFSQECVRMLSLTLADLCQTILG